MTHPPRYALLLLTSLTTLSLSGWSSRNALAQDSNGATYYPAVFDRLSPSYLKELEIPEGAVRSPANTPGQEAALFLEALSEEAEFQVNRAIDSILPPKAKAEAVGPEQTIDKDWVKVDDTAKTPYKAICHLDCWFKTKAGTLKNMEGTGFMVSPRIIVTNAHNLYRDNMNKWVTKVVVYPGRNGNVKPYQSQAGATFIVPGEWLGDDDKAYDIGWIILPDRTLHNRGADYNFSFRTTTDASLKSLALNCVGFPDSETYNYRMYKDYETKDQVVAPRTFKHWLDTSSGSSGSPLYYIDSATKVRYVVGVHCAHSLSNEKGHPFNYATRFTKTYVEWTRDFAQQNP